jgi:hypothetical protein
LQYFEKLLECNALWFPHLNEKKGFLHRLSNTGTIKEALYEHNYQSYEDILVAEKKNGQ